MILIDPHVHLRDWNQSHKETLAHGLSVAWRAGLSGVFEMPNPDPPLTTRSAVERRIREVDALGLAIFHGIYIGLTGDPDQVAAAVDCHGELFPRVVGFKLYAGHSTGRMGVIATEAQRTVWNALAKRGYQGVVAIHAEREELLRPDLWDPSRPASHSDARPPLAEIASVQTQLAFAEAAGFRGTLHICHVSCPETVELILRERPSLPFETTIGATPHHLLLDTSRAAAAVTPEYNVNPPLRDPGRRLELYDRLIEGEISWIESDHAPHTWEEKLEGASGLPGLPAFRLLAEDLRRRGLDVSRLAGGEVLTRFGLDPGLFPENPESEVIWPDREADAAGFLSIWLPLSREYQWDPYRPPAEETL
jgi:dihydroorotase